MCRWLLALVLTVASATAWAQSASPADATLKAQEIAAVAERRVAALRAERAQLVIRYEGELRAIDRLKQQRKTWNRDRELKSTLATAHETATRLSNLDRRLAAAQRQLASTRTALVAAIDFELARKPVAARARVLQRLREQLVPKVRRPSAQRIAIPNLDVDPNADPEDLDAQAAALRQIEAELQRQINGLDKQSKDLERVAELRKSHDRTIAFDRREDNTPTRNAPNSNARGGAAEDAASPQSDNTSTGGGEPPPASTDGGFESEASIVLQDVVDPATIDTLNRAQRSGDPAKRAKAAAKTRDAVRRKLELLRQKRALIEQRAKQLRN